MVSVGSFDAKTHLPALLARVAKGETVQITRRGVPVAQLVPVKSQGLCDAKMAADRIRQTRQGVLLKGLDIREMINEGRR